LSARNGTLERTVTDSSVEVFTIGHSTLACERFLELLRRWSVTAIADVRTAPYSRHSPQFNKATLRNELRQSGIAYVFLGAELGGRPTDKEMFCDGVADYEKMARTPEFLEGLKRVIKGAKRYRIAMMCSEHDPLDCHRCLLVGRALHERGIQVNHILSNGKIMKHADAEMRLMTLSGGANPDFFASGDQQRALAYRQRASRVAYSEDRIQSHIPSERSAYATKY
jgi:uncharacterized protein (DUF488 family)